MRDHIWQPDEIFVFGSNLDGVHGAGAALFARKNCGAVLGVGEGLTGQSYALPTCKHAGVPLSLEDVGGAIDRFLMFADYHPELKFFMTACGTGIAGFSHEQIAGEFCMIPNNCRMPPEWEHLTADAIAKSNWRMPNEILIVRWPRRFTRT